MTGAPVEAVRRVPLFAELDRHEVEQIARLFKERRFAEGETVVREASGGAAFFLIDSGEATVSVGGRPPMMASGPPPAKKTGKNTTAHDTMTLLMPGRNNF